MKAREDRRRVMIRARMRHGALWTDACILNISPRGLGMQSAVPPVRGSYVEIRRGRHVVIARVAWSKGHRFGLQSQDPVAIDAIIREPDLSQVPGQVAIAAEPRFERRSELRIPDQISERSREFERHVQYGAIAVLAAAAALIAFHSVSLVLTRPLAAVVGSLDAG